MPEQVLKQKIDSPKKGFSYIVHSDGFVYEVKADHLSKYYRHEKKYQKEIQELADEGRKVTKTKLKIEKGYLYYTTRDGVFRVKWPGK